MWLRRYRDEGLEGLRSRSSKPHHPHATDAVNKIVYLRQHYYFSPMKIKMSLKRYHDIDITCSAVHRILRKLGVNRLPACQRYKRHDKRYTRYEKQQPGNRLQTDVKLIEPIGLPEQAPPRRRSPRPCPSGGGERSTTSSPPSTTAPGCGSRGSTPDATTRPPSSSSTTSRSPSRSDRSESR
ncbi:helix-turn-helix domain-containing protein [Streptomyces virginiae]|uniref:helix-turn-helix domain-containing protein n=1 Tax=Streptomyces virginiae TaxID=1961 RepID=UPI000A856B06